jgi:tripeptide aminopeptidase
MEADTSDTAPASAEIDLEDLVHDIATIASIPSPTFAEEARLVWIGDRLQRASGRTRRDAVGNVIWSWGDARPRILLTAHVDTVFPLSTPIVIQRHGDRIVGPGVGDNAAAIAVVIHVVDGLLRDRGLDSAAVAFTVGEEGLGNLRGARHVCSEMQPSNVIALEGHGLGSVIADAVGSIRARLSVIGPGGHAWQDRAHPSAIHGLVKLAAATLRNGERDSPVNIGLINGGLAVNAIAGEAELVLEKRSADAATLSRFVDHLGALECDPGLDLTVEILGDRPAGSLPRDSTLLTTVLGVRRKLGLPELIEAGSTDANAAMGMGIPALGLGVANGADMHTERESIDVKSLAVGAEQIAQVLTSMLG